jgi:hypothetical protein
MLRSYSPYLPSSLRVVPVAIGLLLLPLLFAAPRVSANTAQVQICFAECTQGDTTVSFTGTQVNIPAFSISPGVFGPGTYDSFNGITADLFSNGTASGGATIWFANGGGGAFFGGDFSISSWSLSGTPGDMTLTLSGGGLFCGPTCETIFLEPPSWAPATIAITEANIPTPGIPTPEPSPLLLLGSGLLGLLPVNRGNRCRTRT